MTDELKATLEKHAAHALKHAQHELVRYGTLYPTLWVPDEDGTIRRLDLTPVSELLNSDAGKNRLFIAIRSFVAELKLPFTVFVSEAYSGTLTQKAIDYGIENLRHRKVKADLTDLVAEGFIERDEVIMVTAQESGGECVLVRQPFERDELAESIRLGPVEIVAAGKLEGRASFVKGRSGRVTCSMNTTYILDGRTPVPEPDLIAWSDWFGSADRRVDRTLVGELTVSTVFLGIDHRWGRGRPLLFETMVFTNDGEADLKGRVTTWDEAEKLHNRAVMEIIDATVRKLVDDPTTRKS